MPAVGRGHPGAEEGGMLQPGAWGRLPAGADLSTGLWLVQVGEQAWPMMWGVQGAEPGLVGNSVPEQPLPLP